MYRKTITLGITVVCFLLLEVGSAMAAQPLTSAPPPNDVEVDFSVGIKSLQLLALGECLVTQDGSNARVVVDGITIALFSVDSVSVKPYLQRWTGSAWTNVTSKSYSDTNTDQVEGMYSYSVTRGYYYRVKCYHSATDNGISESIYSYTDDILID